MELVCGAFSPLVCVCNIQYSEMKWRGNKKEDLEFQYTTLPATVNESWKSTSSLHFPNPPSPLANEDVNHELNTFMGTF